MNLAKEFLKQGWEFEYDPATRFVGANHPKGGKQSICEVVIKQPYARDEFGFALADFLNKKKT